MPSLPRSATALSVVPTTTNDVPTQTTSKQRHHQRNDSQSTSGDSVYSPPQKKSVAEAPFSAPDCNQLKQALQSGGKTDLDVKNVLLRHRIEQVDFYPIPTCKLDDLINGLGKDLDGHGESGGSMNKAAFDIKTAQRFSGHVRAEAFHVALLGVGAFKTTQAMELTLSPLKSSGLGSAPNQRIAAKRPFYNPSGGVGRPPYIRLTMGDESQRLYREANVLYWAIALLDLAYDYIDQCIVDAVRPPPFKVPRLRFVEAGLLFAYSADCATALQGPDGPQSGTVGTTYLAEEVINGDFFKYIHNGSATPCHFPNPMPNEIAEFLSFTQHVQYTKTDGQVYISDYQGSTTLLTDPQILTHPDVGAGLNLFGDGNVEKGVELFEQQHDCSDNKYCQWPGFKLPLFTGDSF